MLNVLSIRIVQLKRLVLTNIVRIHAKFQLAALMQNVKYMIIQQIVIAVMVLWETLSFIVYHQFHHREIKLPIHVCHHHVCREVFVMFMGM